MNFKCLRSEAKNIFILLQDEEGNTITYSFGCQENLIFPEMADQTAYF